MRESARFNHRDPDAAALLSAQAARGRRVGTGVASVYDPLDIYCRLAREFGWSDAEMDAMDYVRFFGYVDRLTRQVEREQAERDTRMRSAGGGYGDASTVAAAFPEIRPYEGRTVAYG